MSIKDALNTIVLNILFDKKLQLKVIRGYDCLTKSYIVKLSEGIFKFYLSINRKVLGNNDIYYLTCMFKKVDDEMISFCESYIKVPHNDLFINDVLNQNELLEFIHLFNKESVSSYWTITNKYNNSLINYASTLINKQVDNKFKK